MNTHLVFQQLHSEMTQRPFLMANPVLQKVTDGSMTAKQLAEAIRQYVRFPEMIVKMLQAAAGHFPDTHPVHKELRRNWGQENGSATGGVPHVEMLKHALQRDLGLDADAAQASSATHEFLSTVLVGMEGGPWFALGQAYALEASAVPELAVIVGPAINALASKIGRTQPIQKVALQEDGTLALPSIDSRQQAFAMTMSDWFALHIADFEVGHRDFLRERATAVLTDDAKQKEFVRGFRQVLDAMDRWWLALSGGVQTNVRSLKCVI